MQNPKYKFFRDELEDFEVSHFQDRSEIGGNWSTPEISAGVEKIIIELENQGFKRTVNISQNSLSFAKPEHYNAAYIGTFVNPYSFEDKLFWYSDVFMLSYKCITLTEAAPNKATKTPSIVMTVQHFPGGKSCEYITAKNEINPGKTNKYGLLIPETYIKCCSVSEDLKLIKIKKFKPSISKKILNQTIDKAISTIDKISINDMSQFEADCNDFPPDTTKKYWEWKNNPLN